MCVSLPTVLPSDVSNQFWLRGRNVSARDWVLACSNFTLVILLQTSSSQASLVLPFPSHQGSRPRGAFSGFLPFGAAALMSVLGGLAVAVLSCWTLCCHCQSDNWWSELGLSRNPTSVQGPLIYPDSVEQTGKGVFEGAWPMRSLQAVSAHPCRLWCPLSDKGQPQKQESRGQSQPCCTLLLGLVGKSPSGDLAWWNSHLRNAKVGSEKIFSSNHLLINLADITDQWQRQQSNVITYTATEWMD